MDFIIESTVTRRPRKSIPSYMDEIVGESTDFEGHEYEIPGLGIATDATLVTHIDGVAIITEELNGGDNPSTPVSTPVPDNCEVTASGDWLCGGEGTDIPYV